MLKMLICAAALAFASIAPANAEFVGTLKLQPAGCESAGQCKLGLDFGFIDSKGIGWQAQAGDTTDGATIPFWAKPILGGAFEPAFIKAAVIHDHYCGRYVRTWRDTHRVFHEALIASGVDMVKAKIMYYGVVIGGPKWVELIKGVPCPVGKSCIQNVNVEPVVPNASIAVGADGARHIARPSRYDRPDMAEELQKAAELIAHTGGSITLDDLDARARTREPQDFFFNSGAAIRFTGPAETLPVK